MWIVGGGRGARGGVLAMLSSHRVAVLSRLARRRLIQFVHYVYPAFLLPNNVWDFGYKL